MVVSRLANYLKDMLRLNSYSRNLEHNYYAQTFIQKLSKKGSLFSQLDPSLVYYPRVKLRFADSNQFQPQQIYKNNYSQDLQTDGLQQTALTWTPFFLSIYSHLFLLELPLYQ